eukprot:scaffold30078_cov44-Cyclotella_meneghiniana.AAC.4
MPHMTARFPIDCCVDFVASAVMVTAMAFESSRPTPTKVAERFAMVLVGCGDDYTAIPRLPAMVGVVEVSWSLVVFVCEVESGRNSRRLCLATCARAHDRGFSCPS